MQSESAGFNPGLTACFKPQDITCPAGSITNKMLHFGFTQENRSFYLMLAYNAKVEVDFFILGFLVCF
jgi:hypothetical protein